MENTEFKTSGAEGVEQMAGATGEDLFQAYQDGKSFEELKDMFSGGTSDDEEHSPAEEVEQEQESEEIEEDVHQAEQEQKEAFGAEEETEEKPYVFKSQKAYQEHFNKVFNRRHAETLAKLDEQEKTVGEMSTLLSSLLGVPKEKALEELRARHYAVEAEQKGYADPNQYAALKQAENELAEFKRQEQERQIGEKIADIRRQGSVLAQKIPGFDLDGAMEDELFRQTVFTLQRAGAQDSVERAFRAVFFDDFIKKSEAAQKKGEAMRPREGAAGAKTKTAVKTANVAGLSGSQIKDLERRILSGEKVEL